MEESFDLPVIYQGKKVVYPGKIVTVGYTYKIYISVDSQEIIFEPDEERNLRAILENAQAGLSQDLIRIIGEALEHHLH